MSARSNVGLTLAALAFLTVFALTNVTSAVPVTDGLILYLDATDPSGDGSTGDGASVTSWTDKSPMGNSVVQSLGAAPTYVSGGINGNGSINFAGGDPMHKETFDGIAPGDSVYTAFTVMQSNPAGHGGNERLWEIVSGRAEPAFAGDAQATIGGLGFWYGHQNGASPQIRLGVHFEGEGESSTPDWDGTPHLLEVQYQGGGNYQHYQDGADDGAGGNLDGFTGFPDPEGARLSVGSHYQHPADNVHFTGTMGDIVIFNRLLSDDERNKVGNHLAGKWGIETEYIPEPSSLLLLTLGLVALLGYRRRDA